MQVWAVAWLLRHVASQVQDSVSAVRGMMERCIAAHQLVTRGRAGKCGNAGARCYAHTMPTLCWICWICSVFLLRREKEVLMRLDRLARAAGSMSPATGVNVKE